MAAEPETADNLSHRAGEPGDRATAIRARVLAEIKSDWLLYAIVGIYVLAAGALAAAMRNGNQFKPYLYISGWVQLGFSSVADLLVPFAVIAVIAAVWNDPARPFSELIRIIRRAFGPRLIAGLPLMIAMALFYGTFTSVKDMLPQFGQFRWDATLADLDKVFAGGARPGHLTMKMTGPHSLAVLEFIYGAVWFVLMLGLSTLVAISEKFAHLRHRYLLAFFGAWILAGNVLAALFLSGGPCFYGKLTGDPARFASLCQSLASTLSENERRYLWHFYQSGESALGTGISAFPSVHLVAATLVGLLLWQIDRRLGWIAVLYVAIIEFGSVRLGWHYAIDGYAGILIAILCWWVSGLIVRSASLANATTAAAQDQR